MPFERRIERLADVDDKVGEFFVFVHNHQCVLYKSTYLGEIVVLAVAEMHGVGIFVLPGEGYLVDAVADAFQIVAKWLRFCYVFCCEKVTKEEDPCNFAGSSSIL